MSTRRTPVERLRAAEALLRERAGKATPGPWVVDPAEPHYDYPDFRGADLRSDSNTLIAFDAEGGALGFDDATHIATMSPPVAMAMAEVLRVEADRVDLGAQSITFDGAPMFPPRGEMVALADALLGGGGA